MVIMKYIRMARNMMKVMYAITSTESRYIILSWYFFVLTIDSDVAEILTIKVDEIIFIGE